MAMPVFRAALVLGLLSAVGPFSIDLYLPAMPVLTADLNGTVSEAQFTLTAFFLTFGIGQMFYGPWSDQVGRKRPLYIGLSIFVLGSIGCALAPDLSTLAWFRALQGLGAAVVMVIPRAIIRDMHTGTAATRLMAMVMLVISVSPFLAPLAGSGMIALAGWRVIFWGLCVAAAFSLVMTGTLLPETLAPEHRVPVHLRSLMRGARKLLRDPTFMGLTFIGGFGTASFFIFIASASFVYTGQFGLGPVGFSLAFAINALGFFGASQIAAPLGERFGMLPVVGWAVGGFATVTVALAVITALGFAGLPLIVAGLFAGNACLGLVIPTTLVMALDEHGDVAGLASSLGGTLQMLTGGVMIALGGPFFDGTAVPMVTAIAISAVMALMLAGLTLPRLARATGLSRP